jgi:FdhD protein
MPLSKAPGALTRPVTQFSFAGAHGAGLRDCAVETPVNIVYAPVPYAVMMATPQDLEDFALGFSVSEGVIDGPSDIRSIVVEEAERGLRLVVTLASDKLQRHLARVRNLAGRTGCGLCGVDDLKALPAARPPTHGPGHLLLSSVRRALLELEPRQTLNRRTHALHGAAWADHAGHLLMAREDVGRQNALDKLIGALLRADVDPGSGFVVITSRCSYEMVEKAAAFGARALVAISAPTTFAIERAEANAMTLVALARADGAICFTDPAFVTDDLQSGGRRIA